MPVIRHVSRRPGRFHSRGLSLVELMVGVAVGLFIVAAGALLASSQLSDNRSLLIETQLQQDLRATADIIARDLRRSTFLPDADGLVPRPVITDPAAVPAQWKTRSNLTNRTALYNSTNHVFLYGYERQSGAHAFGLRIDPDRPGVIQSCVADTDNPNCSGAWQDLTDANTVEIIGFDATSTQMGDRARPDNGNQVRLPCANVCDPATYADSTACWPSVNLDEVVLWITGRSRADSRVVRTLKTTIRVRGAKLTMPLLDPTYATGSACPELP